jgi:hypothetical protein
VAVTAARSDAPTGHLEAAQKCAAELKPLLT